jgi:hypothetical protein
MINIVGDDILYNNYVVAKITAPEGTLRGDFEYALSEDRYQEGYAVGYEARK